MWNWIKRNWQKITGAVVTGACGALSGDPKIAAACGVAGTVIGAFGDREAAKRQKTEMELKVEKGAAAIAEALRNQGK
jgi:outer membrane lipoprotein SlyB